jgi:integrase
MSASTRTKREAEEAERAGRDRERRRRLGLPAERGPILYGELCDRYLAQHQVSDRTIRTLRERLASSRRTFGSRPVRELRPETISRWNAGLPVGATTRGHNLRAMRQVLEQAVRWGYLPANPAGAGLVRMPSTAPSDVRPLESWADVYAVADAAGAYRPLVVFACATGLRPQEWRALAWSEVDLRARTVRVSRTARDDGAIEATTKTDGSLRTVALQERAYAELAGLPRPIDSRQLVFPAPGGGVVNLSNFRTRVWEPALREAGLEHRPPSQMRHTFATLSLSAGAPVEWIGKQLGHTSIRTTLKHYARFLPAADDRAIAALDSFERGAGLRTDCVQTEGEAE